MSCLMISPLFQRFMQGSREDDAEARFNALERPGKSMSEFAASVMKWGNIAQVPASRQVRAFKAGLTQPEIMFVFGHPQVTTAGMSVTMDILMDVANVYQNLYRSSATGISEAHRTTQRGVLLTPGIPEEDTSSVMERSEEGDRAGILAIQRTTDRWATPPPRSTTGGFGPPASAGSVITPSIVGPSASVAPGNDFGAEALRQLQALATGQRQFQELMEKRWQEAQNRSTSRRGCYHCGNTEHRSGQCPQRGDRWGPGSCMNCGVAGHIAAACPHPRRQGPLQRCAWFSTTGTTGNN